MVKRKKEQELEQQLEELTIDLQRTRADFENFRKRMEIEKEQARSIGKSSSIVSLLPVIDTIERAISHAPKELADNPWVKGIVSIRKQLDKSLEQLNLHRIEASPGTEFDPTIHEAISMDDADGEKELISEELQPGYKLGNNVIRHSMVRVTRAK